MNRKATVLVTGILSALAVTAATLPGLLGSTAEASPAPAVPAPTGTLTPPPAGQTVTENGPYGMNQQAALSAYGGGSPNVVIAYVEGGINWHLPEGAALADSTYVNWKEAPVPCTGATVATATMTVSGSVVPCQTLYTTDVHDYDGAGHPSAADWAHDPRLTDANGNGVIDPEDLVSAFCGAGYDPPEVIPGYRCDIAGWDFYDNQNDPATTDAAYTHSDDQMTVLHTECPNCTIMPIKAGDEALDRTDDLAKAWLFACQSGANVIVSVTADLGYSTFMGDVVQYCESKGVLMLESSNDFDSNDHQGGMLWPYVIPGNGAVANAAGTGWVRSDETSWGPHSMFTVATTGGSTSESTPTTGGLLGLLLSYGEEAAVEGRIAAPLTGDQVVQLMRATATPFTNPALGWPGGGGSSDGWNEQYGYGMPDVLAAAQDIFGSGGEVSPTATITSPKWYALEDPTTTSSVTVSGTVSAGRPTDGYTWTLESALGGQPTDSQWSVIGTGSGTGSYSGVLGTLNLSTIPQSFWDAPFSLSAPPTGNKALPTTDQYDVTFRLIVTDTTEAAAGTGATSAALSTAEDRRVVYVEHDSSLASGFPIDNGASIESQPALVDLQGSGLLDIVYADSDGVVHALNPKTGQELPGWPVHTNPVTTIGTVPAGVDPGYESVLDPVAVGDLDHTGALSVVVTGVDGGVYVFDAQGRLEPGWPQYTDLNVTAPPIPRPSWPNVRYPQAGASASPVLAPLAGKDGPLSIVQAGWDGYIHVWNADGTNAPGWPVKVGLPSTFTPGTGYTLENDQKLDSPPAVAYFDGPDNPPSLVIRNQQSEIFGSGVEPLPTDFVFAYNANGTLRNGWPISMMGIAEFYGSAQEFITEGTASPAVADVYGNGHDDVEIGPMWTPPSLVNGSGQVIGTYGNTLGALGSLAAIDLDKSLAQTPGDLPQEYPIPFTTSGAFGKLGPPGSPLTFAESDIGSSTFVAAELVNDSELAIDQYMSVYPAAPAPLNLPTSEEPGFPATRQGLDFLGEPAFADVSGGGNTAVITGGDSEALAAYTSTGAEVPGFPKFTGGWITFTPTTGDLFGNGDTEVVAGTREGYLFVWKTTGSAAANTQWWHAQHDEWNSGNYGTDSRPPGIARNLTWTAGSLLASFTAPGDNWYDGTVGHYRVTYEPSGATGTYSPSGPAGTTQYILVPPGTTGFTVRSYDQAGNVSAPTSIGNL